MKRSYSHLLVGVLLLVLAGCTAQVPGQALVGLPVTVITTVSSVATKTTTATLTTTAISTKTATATVTVTGGGADVPVAAAGPSPADFYDYGNGLSATWAADDSYDCAEADDSCWGVLIYSQDGCPTGPYVLLTLFGNGTDESGSSERRTNQAIAAGETIVLVLGYQGPDTATITADLTDVRCQ